MKSKIQLDATYYITMLMLGSTCFEHHYAHHHEITAMDGWMDGCPDRWLYSHRSGHPSILPAPNVQPEATREPDDLCGNQRYRRDLVMMGIMVPKTC